MTIKLEDLKGLPEADRLCLPSDVNESATRKGLHKKEKKYLAARGGKTKK